MPRQTQGNKPRKQITLSLDQDVILLVRECAKKYENNMSKFVEQAIKEKAGNMGIRK